MTNLVLNGSFEQGLTNWAGEIWTEPTNVQFTTLSDAYDGLQSAAIVYSTGQTGNQETAIVQYWNPTQVSQLVAGQPITLSAAYKTRLPYGNITLQFFNASSVNLGADLVIPTSLQDGVWHTASASGIIPVGIAYVKVYAYAFWNPVDGAAGTAQFDAIDVEVGAAPPSTFPLAVTAYMGGTTYPTSGVYQEASGTTVPVQANPSVGWMFDSFVLDGIRQTSNPINVPMNAAHILNAYFKLAPATMPATSLMGVQKIGLEYTNDWVGRREVNPSYYDFDADNMKNAMKANYTRVSFNSWHYMNDPTYKANVLAWVHALTSRGIMVVMDLHSYGQDFSIGITQGNQKTDAATALSVYNTTFKPCLLQVAQDFISEPYMIGVQINEFWPLTDDNPQWTFDLQVTQDLAVAIHAINPQLYIFADMYDTWVTDATLSSGVGIITEPKVVFCPHYYVWNNDLVSPNTNDGKDCYSTYNSGDYANGKAKMYTWFEWYYNRVQRLYNVPYVLDECAVDSKAGSLQALNDLIDYFIAHKWGFCYFGYYGEDTPSLHLLKSDWRTLQPQGEIFVSKMQVVSQYILTLATTVGGTTNPAPGQYTETQGQIVQITAVPDSGYRFDHWLLDGLTVTNNAISLTMDQNHNATAYFTVTVQQVTLNIATNGNGTVNYMNGPQTFNVGDTVTFSATPATNNVFNQWTLNGTTYTANPLSMQIVSSMNGKTLTAYFAVATITLSVVAGSNGAVSPSGTQTLMIGQSYQFVAIPDIGYQLDHWDLSGQSQGSSNPLTLIASATMNGKTLTALFTSIPPRQITLNIATSGNGTVNLSIGQHTFNVGDRVTFTATPATNNAFIQWTLNGTIYTGNPVTVQITDSMNGQTLTAVFVLTAINLTVVSGANGSVAPSGNMILTIAQSYLFNATASVGYSLDHWDLGGANLGSTNPISILATADMNGKTLTALFTLIPPVQISLNIHTNGNGVTNPTVGTQIFNVGDSISFSAIPNAGQTFTKWTLDGTIYTDNPLTLLITENMNGKTLTAEFTGPPLLAGFPIWAIPVALVGVGIFYLATKKK